MIILFFLDKKTLISSQSLLHDKYHTFYTKGLFIHILIKTKGKGLKSLKLHHKTLITNTKQNYDV